MVALSFLGSAILLFSCGGAEAESDGVNKETLMTERSENLTILMSENGRRSYHFKTPLLEGYTLAADPYREFRKGVLITTYQNDSLTTVNATLVANYAIYYEKRELWEAKGDVVVEKADGTKLYTQQLFWNSKMGRIYSNVDSKIVKGSDTFMGEGFESDEELKEWRFRRMSGKMLVNMEPTENPDSTATVKSEVQGAKTESSTKSGSEVKKSNAEGAKSKSESKKRGSVAKPANNSGRNGADVTPKSIPSTPAKRTLPRSGDGRPSVQRGEKLRTASGTERLKADRNIESGARLQMQPVKVDEGIDD